VIATTSTSLVCSRIAGALLLKINLVPPLLAAAALALLALLVVLACVPAARQAA
jgi:hypothetical protein